MLCCRRSKPHAATRVKDETLAAEAVPKAAPKAAPQAALLTPPSEMPPTLRAQDARLAAFLADVSFLVPLHKRDVIEEHVTVYVNPVDVQFVRNVASRRGVPDGAYTLKPDTDVPAAGPSVAEITDALGDRSKQLRLAVGEVRRLVNGVNLEFYGPETVRIAAASEDDARRIRAVASDICTRIQAPVELLPVEVDPY